MPAYRNKNRGFRFQPRARRQSWIRRLLTSVLIAIGACYAAYVLSIVALRWINPITTSIQIERRVEALLQQRAYLKHSTPITLGLISPNLQHAVVAAEDSRFFQHHGFDWLEMEKVLERDVERRQLGRGASTITQQLVKNLFLTTERSVIRKGVEFTLVPVAETFLSKRRILEIYLNVIEWGPGVYGAEAAAEFYYHQHAVNLTREQSARLAAVIPAPLRRKPNRMDEYSGIILDRMSRMGW